jgi:penicillin amidase
MKRVAAAGVLGLVFFILGCMALLIILFLGSRPTDRGEISSPNIASEVRVIVDRWGVPHVSARSEADLFFAAGYLHARERMWQMELLRRMGLGRLSEVFGERTLQIDIIFRNLGLRQAAVRDYENLSTEIRELMESYCRGVNAWLASKRLTWPPEFLLLRYRPEPWTVLDSLVIKGVLALGLCTDFPSELVRAGLVAELGLPSALEILEKDAFVTTVDDIPPVGLAADSFRLVLGASNSWVLAGSRTETGRPLLANDPHLELSLPAPWYQIDLRSPLLHVAGVSIPGLPLVVIGHNESIAWGVTNSGADVEDLYVERLNESRDSYWDKEGWRPLERDVELVRVRGREEPERVEILRTVRGPVLLPQVVSGGRAVSLRWTIHDGGRLFESALRLNAASNWEEFSRALELWDAPSQNFVYADIRGNIGYYLSGRLPVRSKASALFPSWGWKEANQWHGYIPEDAKPNLFDPPRGLIVAANQKIVPDDYPYYVSCDFETPFRAERIEELLLARPKHSVGTLETIQNDVFSKRAELILPYIRELSGLTGKAKEARDILASWRGDMSSGGEPALFMAFMYELQQETFARRLGGELERFGDIFYRKTAGLLRVLPDPLSPWFGAGGREEILRASLARAMDWLEKTRGRADSWDWMRMHAATFRHALGGRPPFGFFDRGPYPLDGDVFCVRASFSKDLLGNFSPTDGVSYRQIIDLSDWRRSVCLLDAGQSGHVLSRHYADQIPLWLKGEYRPMLFAAEDIEAAAAGVILMRPAPPAK